MNSNVKYLRKEGKLYQSILKAAKKRAEEKEELDRPQPKRKGGCSCHG